MNMSSDHEIIKHTIVAMRRRMTPAGAKEGIGDTLFIGGPQLLEAGLERVAAFAQAKNYKIVYAAFGDEPAAGPESIHVVVTDGVSDTATLRDARLWQGAGSDVSVLLFDEHVAQIGLDDENLMSVVEGPSAPAPLGFTIASAALTLAASARPGPGTSVTDIGGIPVVMDMEAFLDMFRDAA